MVGEDWCRIKERNNAFILGIGFGVMIGGPIIIFRFTLYLMSIVENIIKHLSLWT